MSDELPPPDPRDVALRELLAAVDTTIDVVGGLLGCQLRREGHVPGVDIQIRDTMRPAWQALNRARAAIEEIGT